MSQINDYAPIVGDSFIDELRLLAERLEGRTVQNINSTSVGGGVAEILLRMLPLLQDLGLEDFGARDREIVHTGEGGQYLRREVWLRRVKRPV